MVRILRDSYFEGMWKKENFYFEQATVNFRNELILEILTDDTLTGTESFQYSTVKSIN